MKKFKTFAYASAMLLAGTMAFTACSSSDDAVDATAEVNPTYNGESVKTQFAINIPRAASTRMTDTIAQAQSTPVFRGMNAIHLIPLDTVAGNPAGTLTTATSSISKVISLPSIAADNGWSSEGVTATAGSTKIYKDVEIESGVNHFLFYGRAIGDNGAVDKKFEYGALDSTITNVAKVSDIKFNLHEILESSDEFKNQKDSMQAYINAVCSLYAATAPHNYTSSSNKYTWKDTLSQLTCGSANAILHTMQKLYDAEKVESFKKELLNVTNSKGIQVKLGNDNVTLEWVGGSVAAKNFPKNLNLPDGAVPLNFNTDATNNAYFSYVDNVGGTIKTSGDNQVSVSSLTYPASLFYFVSTPLLASESDAVQFPNESGWGSSFTKSTETTGAVWNLTTVNTNTKSIALQYPVNYGVALLKSSVTCAFGLEQLADNGAKFADATENSIKIPEAGFPVTGLLIGGQPTTCGYDMTPTSTTSQSYFQTVYDKKIAYKVAAKKYESNPTSNYTIVLDDRKAEGNSGSTKDVYVAIELTNNTGTNFYGADGLILEGQTFYLVGKLTFEPDTNKPNLKSVFTQDYTTNANFTISSLKNAYSCIPDLRSSSLRLGLHVDLTWQTGLTYDVTIE